MKYLRLTIATAMIALLAISTAISEEIFSLRGENDLANLAEMFKKDNVISQQGGFKRSWKLQPPAISHTIEKDVINLDENSCMRCHSPAKYKEEKAIKISDSHFIRADGTKSETLDGRRYFCSQCHTTQKDVEPLVGNIFDSGGN